MRQKFGDGSCSSLFVVRVVFQQSTGIFLSSFHRPRRRSTHAQIVMITMMIIGIPIVRRI
jgi:hypothetical protein